MENNINDFKRVLRMVMQQDNPKSRLSPIEVLFIYEMQSTELLGDFLIWLN